MSSLITNCALKHLIPIYQYNASMKVQYDVVSFNINKFSILPLPQSHCQVLETCGYKLFCMLRTTSFV